MEVKSTATSAESKLPDMNVNKPEVEEEKIEVQSMVTSADSESNLPDTGRSLSEAFILTSTNPQYDKRFFINLPVQYMKSLEHGENILCTQIVFCFDIQNNLCTQHVLPMF